MVASVGRKKKEADRVNYNISRSIRSAVLREAAKAGRNEIDLIEDLLRYGLTAKVLLKEGQINYAKFTQRMDLILNEGGEEQEPVDNVAAKDSSEEQDL